jgi:glucosamine--fructose-6-phosphate aminotransferase (isomerizing)
MSVWDDILSQPENLRHVIEAHRRADLRRPLEKAAELANGCTRILFTGVGSGLNATIPAFYYLMNRGRAAEYIDTTELVYNLYPGMAGSLLVLNTRSGETAELIRAAELARRAGVPSIAVTNEPGSTVARLADACLPTYSRWDDLVVISAYGGMLVSELVLASYIEGQLDALFSELEEAPQAVEATIKESINNRQELWDLFANARPIYLLGRGPSIASAYGGALVIEETSRHPVTPMATGLFRQGPIEVVDERFRALIFEGAGEPARLTKILAAELVKKGAGIAWVGSSQLSEALQIHLPELSAYLLPLVEIIPCQVLAHDLAQRAGIIPGSVRYIQKVITGEEGIPGGG